MFLTSHIHHIFANVISRLGFIKMALSLMPMPYSFDRKALWSQTKYVVMNVWNYFEREAQKSGQVANCTSKVVKATGKW